MKIDFIIIVVAFFIGCSLMYAYYDIKYFNKTSIQDINCEENQIKILNENKDGRYLDFLVSGAPVKNSEILEKKLLS